MLRFIRVVTFVAGLAGVLFVLSGCSQSPPPPIPPADPVGHVSGKDHVQHATKVPDTEEQKLYLTPGGKYTEADIQANGNRVASVQFKGLKARHDVKPQPGDKLCPISQTKANPQFSWVVGGQTYEFCCPPCVDEFITLAKEKPEEIMSPEFYQQK